MEAQVVRNFRLQFFDFLALKFHNALAVLTDDVVVIGVIGVVGIVKLVVFAKIDFSHQPALRQQRKRPINSGPRNRFFPFAGPIQQLLGGKVLFGIENRVDNGPSLSRQPKPLSRNELNELLLR